MAVPSSGQLSLGGIYSELDQSNYSELNDEEEQVSLKEASDGSIATINTLNLAANRPDGTAPLPISDFYSYDHDKTLATFTGRFIEDYDDGDDGTGTREHFDTTSTGNVNSTGIAPESGAQPGADNGSGTVTVRPSWTKNGGVNNVSNAIRLTNTNDSNHSFVRSTNATSFGSGGVSINTGQQWEWIWSIFMNSTNNKDMIMFIQMSSSGGSSAAQGDDMYRFQFHDNVSSTTGKLEFKRYDNGSVTTLGGVNSAYSLGATAEFKVLRFYNYGSKVANGTWKMYVNGSQKLSITDNTYSQMYRIAMFAPKAMSTPISTHYHEYDYVSVRRVL